MSKPEDAKRPAALEEYDMSNGAWMVEADAYMDALEAENRELRVELMSEQTHYKSLQVASHKRMTEIEAELADVKAWFGKRVPELKQQVTELEAEKGKGWAEATKCVDEIQHLEAMLSRMAEALEWYAVNTPTIGKRAKEVLTDYRKEQGG